jgi:phosphoglycerate transporter family protein
MTYPSQAFAAPANGDAAPVSSPEAIDKAYRYWRIRLMYSLILGYSAFYFVRQNMSIAVPNILDNFGYTKTQVGWIFSSFSIIYGIAKFISGSICDRSNARYFMALGLLGAATTSVLMGLSHSIVLLGVCYGINGWFQSMGWPACTRILTHWYGPKQLATCWGICNVSHQLGSVIVLLGVPLIIAYTGSWRWAFLAPGFLCILLSLVLVERLRDTPQSLGLPSIEVKEGLCSASSSAGNEPRASYREIFFEHILPNKPLWTICVANFFVYVVRMGFFNWAPTFLKEMKGISLFQSGFQTACFEVAGIFGGVAAGWLSDKVFNGYRGRVTFVYMLLLTLAIAAFGYLPHASGLQDVLLLMSMGFLIYGPQVLIGVAGAEFGSQKAACAAAGLTGTFGYLGGAFSGVGVGFVAQHYGWHATLMLFMAASVLGALCALSTWNQGRCLSTGGLKKK